MPFNEEVSYPHPRQSISALVHVTVLRWGPPFLHHEPGKMNADLKSVPMQVILFGLPCAIVLIPWFAFGNPLPMAVLGILALTSPGQEFLRPFAESLAAAVLSIFIPRRHQERDGGGRGRKSASKKVRSRRG
jgi:hypothetical protein